MKRLLLLVLFVGPEACGMFRIVNSNHLSKLAMKRSYVHKDLRSFSSKKHEDPDALISCGTWVDHEVVAKNSAPTKYDKKDMVPAILEKQPDEQVKKWAECAAAYVKTLEEEKKVALQSDPYSQVKQLLKKQKEQHPKFPICRLPIIKELSDQYTVSHKIIDKVFVVIMYQPKDQSSNLPPLIMKVFISHLLDMLNTPEE